MAKGNFIEYVISDDPNKYPNGSEQDGYYYRKVIKFETEERTVTPTTEDLIVTPVEGKYLNQVTVQGDANFLEENIAEGITIWGKTGTHQGSSVETCTLSIPSASFGIVYCTVYSNGNMEYRKVDVHSENVNSIEKYYNEKNNSVYKFIAISLNEWDIIRQEFITYIINFIHLK